MRLEKERVDIIEIERTPWEFSTPKPLEYVYIWNDDVGRNELGLVTYPH